MRATPMTPVLLALLLSGCPKRIQPNHPVIETAPPQYIWVCDTRADGTIVCDAVPELKDVPSTHECIYQPNGITACWPKEQRIERLP